MKVEENDLTYLEHVKFSYGMYTGQTRCLREYAIKEYGAEMVACMTDEDLERKFTQEGYVPVVVNTFEGADQEGVFLVKKDTLAFSKKLSR